MLNYLLTGDELTGAEIMSLLDDASQFKKERGLNTSLQGKHLAMIFEKPSLRTRLSFTVAMRELGGDVVESDNLNRKHEEPEDLMRVLQGYCHAVMIRTHADSILERMRAVSQIPLINGLSDSFHPCQILADLLTLREHFSSLENLKISYIGDGNNILNSLLLMAPKLGIQVHYCCPSTRKPQIDTKPMIYAHSYPEEAVRGTSAVYTDVWASMGFEGSVDENLFAGYQVNEKLLALANPEAIFMHCMPMIRGKEVSETLPDSPQSVIFQQSENRLHVQKALLVRLYCSRH